MNVFFQKAAGSIVRHGLTLAAGVFVAKGVISEETAAQVSDGNYTDFLMAAGMYVAGQGWSLFQKWVS